MKRFFLFLIVILAFCSFSCEKKSDSISKNSDVIEEPNYDNFEEENKVTTIDFDKMQRIVDNSKTLDVEVFFAISVLHRKFILSCESEAQNLAPEQRGAFYEAKRKEFFDNMKYSEKQYTSFVETNGADLNNYINQFPEIAQYLTTTN